MEEINKPADNLQILFSDEMESAKELDTTEETLPESAPSAPKCILPDGDTIDLATLTQEQLDLLFDYKQVGDDVSADISVNYQVTNGRASFSINANHTKYKYVKNIDKLYNVRLYRKIMTESLMKMYFELKYTYDYILKYMTRETLINRYGIDAKYIISYTDLTHVMTNQCCEHYNKTGSWAGFAYCKFTIENYNWLLEKVITVILNYERTKRD